MPFLNRNLHDGRYAGSTVVDSEGVWVDVDLADLDSSTAESLPETPILADLFVYETSGEAPAYLLFKGHGSLADNAFDGAMYIPAGQGRAFSMYIPDAPISTIALHGTCRVEAIML